MLTDDDKLPLSNMLPEEWQNIKAVLPSEPDRWESIAFINAVNRYRENIASARTTYTRLVTGASVDVRAAVQKLYLAGSADPGVALIREKLSEYTDALERDADNVPRRAIGARLHRDEFLAEALRFWCASGGNVRRSRRPLPPRIPSGPAIRYLECVCKIVMGDEAPATETLAAFIRKWISR
jgi:hypothetical protein